MALNLSLKAACAALAFVAVSAQAVPIKYTFTTTGAHAGTFSYDDSAAGLDISGTSSLATRYSALSFTFDGNSIANSTLDLTFDFDGKQWAIVSTDTQSPALIFVHRGLDLFTTGTAADLNGRTLADFDDLAVYVAPGPDYFFVTSLTQVAAVPEPSTYAMLLLGLAGVGCFVRGRKA